jgi:hypothetical protein
MTRHVVQLAIAAGLILTTSFTAQAAIESLSGTATAEITQYVGTEPASTDISTETFPGTAPGLPMEAFAGLGDFQGVRMVGHGARSIASLADPTLATGADPMELGAEAGVFSDVAHVTYQATSDVEEVRVIRLSSSDLGVGAGATADVISRVFIEGAIVVWSKDSSRDLTGLEGSFDLQIVQDFGSNGSETVASHFVSVLGTSNGEVSVSQSHLPDLIVGGVEVLATSDSEVEAVLADLSTIGVVHVVVLPRSEYAYTYPASPDEPFNLSAIVNVRTENLPEGTGIAVVFGRAAEAISTIFTPVVGSAKAATVQHAVNLAMRDSREIAENDTNAGCGAGILGFPLITSLSWVGWRRLSRRHS